MIKEDVSKVWGKKQFVHVGFVRLGSPFHPPDYDIRGGGVSSPANG